MARAVHSALDTPNQLDLDNGAAIELGVRATTSVNQQCGGVAFYAPATLSGTFTAELYQTTRDDDVDTEPLGQAGTGTLLATKSASAATVSAGLVDGWYEFIFDDPIDCTTGVVYTLAVHSSSGRYVRRANEFGSASKTGNNVTLLQSGTDPNPPGLGSMRNGAFIESATPAYPTSVFENADYYVDWVLVVAEEIDLDGNRSGTASITGSQKAVRHLTGDRTGTASIEGSARQVARTAGDLTGTGSITGSFNVRSDTAALPTTNSAGWYGYLNILHNNREEVRRQLAEQPEACPDCGEPLDSAIDGTLFCPFDGWKWNGLASVS